MYYNGVYVSSGFDYRKIYLNRTLRSERAEDD
jgi:hypothetical protein